MIQNTIYRSDFPIELIESTGADKNFEPIIFRIHAPTFVWSELRRFQTEFSYSDQLNRDDLVLPEFYIPPNERPLAGPKMLGTKGWVKRQQDICVDTLVGAYDQSWYNYQHQIHYGVSREVARMCLPEALYTTVYLTCDPHSFLNFLSIVDTADDSMSPSYPQWEISQIAKQMETIFKGLYPTAHDLYLVNRRVSF